MTAEDALHGKVLIFSLSVVVNCVVAIGLQDPVSREEFGMLHGGNTQHERRDLAKTY